jgi:hypothetical protein
MSQLMKKCESELTILAKANDAQRRKILKNSKKCLIKAISEIVLNCLLGNIPMNECRRNKLKIYKNLLKKLANRTTSLDFKRKLILQKGSGFLSILLPVALEAFRFVYNKLKPSNQ